MMKPLLALTLLAALAAPTAALSPVQVGRMEHLAGATGVLVAAPHGGFDWLSDDLARRIALATGAGYLLANGYRTKEHPWNVNRPTEGAGLAPDDERRTPEAAAVYAEWAKQVKAQSPKLYVEIHGNSRAESTQALEVATVGLSDDQARAFKAEFLARVAALDASYPHLGMKIEPFDAMHFHAESAKRQGVFKLVPRVVHIETPKALRAEERVRSRYAWVLAACVDDMSRSLETTSGR